MQSHLWWNILQPAMIQRSSHNAIDLLPAMWLVLPGILPCRPMEGGTTLINWRLQWWIPCWCPILTGTCAFGRVSNLELCCSDLFGWNKITVLQVGWEELAAQCCGVAIADWSLESQLAWHHCADNARHNARSTGPYCGVANGRGFLSMVGELVFTSRIIQVIVQLSPQDF